ncbi:type I 3-dehydroquinate dehydratase [Candidatus Bathyarchaeota archaeon]|nr:MAG: type I 3-dehydroquinate dehydratase [Candidatus Bathyarchaeota archaeon]
MKPKICAVITGKNFKESYKMLKKAEKFEASLVELRIDYLKEKNFSFSRFRKLTNLPIIATNRPIGEGGLTNQPENKRLEVLFKAAEEGFDYVDLELSIKNLDEIVEKIRSLGSKPIISFHDFYQTPSIQKFFEIYRKESKVGAEICKIVTMAKTFSDNLTCLKFVDEVSKKDKIVSFCMGRFGVFSRIFSPIFGGYYTYAAIQRGKESAEGQLTLDRMVKIYGLIGFEA